MKTESTVKYVARLALTLLLITAVVAVALAGVNAITQPRIETFNAQKLQSAIEEVLPGGGESVAFTDDTGLVSTVYKGENGYAVEVRPAGFGGTITMMVGVSGDGKVLGISVVSQAETAGLGAVCAATTSAGEAFRGQFAGTSGSLAVNKDGGEIDAITGATITSRAVTTGVNAALSCVANMG